MHNTYKIQFKGRVQGVGFRPYVVKLARQKGLKGAVSNNEDGVIIHLLADQSAAEEFYECIVQNPPPLSRIKGHSIHQVALTEYRTFDIVPTVTEGKLNLALTPDFGICSSCEEELSDPSNRRYGYPFTTCVNCGPRWSITNTFPFERDHTSMKVFSMCPNCGFEYQDPSDRRFHSQTNSCPECGIKLELQDNKGMTLDVPASGIIKFTADLIRDEKIVAIKNTGGYLLCCDAGNPAVVKKLRRLKKRPGKPFAVLFPGIDQLKKGFSITELQSRELCSAERPIVIISSRACKDSLALSELAPGLRQLGVMLPNSGLMYLLSKELGIPVVATSGNIHGSPVISRSEQAVSLIGEVADYFLHHDLDISNAQDDSVVKFSFKEHQRIMFRRARGYAPNYFDHRSTSDQKILALGGHLKSTIAFTPNDYLYLSQYLGNLDHFEVYGRFEKTVEVFRQIFSESPDCILVDGHPDYLSTRFGEELSVKTGIPLFRIQHHRAHFASVLGEHELFDSGDKVLGVIWDGTGYGDDGHIWGGEFFTYSSGNMDRTGHFEYFNWLAGDKMAREPRLSLFSIHEGRGADIVNRKFDANELGIYTSLKSRNSLKTSSVGRLFDAVASLLGLCDINTYEGEAAILLENAIAEYEMDELKGYASVQNNLKVPTQTLWKNLYKDFSAGVTKERIILNFLYTLARLVVEMGALTGAAKIAMSGGVFQNAVLVDMIKILSRNRYELFFNRNLAPNDENIAFGQLKYHEHGVTFREKEIKEGHYREKSTRENHEILK